MTHARPLIVAGVLLGLGFGGLADGIVLHQILQWHHLLCDPHGCEPTSVADLKAKTRADGVFHAFTSAVALAGVFQLWRAGAARRGTGELASGSGWVLAGAMLAGWGAFNFVEGLIDHQILGIHHVRPGPNQFLWDMAFLASGVAMLAIGWSLIRAGRGPAARAGAGAIAAGA